MQLEELCVLFPETIRYTLSAKMMQELQTSLPILGDGWVECENEIFYVNRFFVDRSKEVPLSNDEAERQEWNDTLSTERFHQNHLRIADETLRKWVVMWLQIAQKLNRLWKFQSRICDNDRKVRFFAITIFCIVLFTQVALQLMGLESRVKLYHEL